MSGFKSYLRQLLHLKNSYYNSYLVLDAATFKLDTASQSQSIFKTGGILKSLVLTIMQQTFMFKVLYRISKTMVFTPQGTYATSLQSDNLNLVGQIPNNKGIVLVETINSISDLEAVKTFIQAKPASAVVIDVNLILGSSFSSTLDTGFTVEQFKNLVSIDTAITEHNLFQTNFGSVKIVDTADNIKGLITSTESSLTGYKDFIKGISSTSNAQDKIQLTWEKYLKSFIWSKFQCRSSCNIFNFSNRSCL